MMNKINIQDSGVCILTTKVSRNKNEYRVSHVYNIRCLWSTGTGKLNYDNIDEEYFYNIFGKSKIYHSKESAEDAAAIIYDRLEISDPFLVSAGIVVISFDKTFKSLCKEIFNAKKEKKKKRKK